MSRPPSQTALPTMFLAATAHRDQQPFVARELDRVDDVGGTQAADHQAWAAVDHGVPDGAGGVVAILSR
jgi:hypothetical protein